jgi:hypothetical protein
MRPSENTTYRKVGGYSTLQRYWPIQHHGRMKAYSGDLRKRIVEAVERGMGKSEAARTFGVSLSSVKRYVSSAR